MKTVAIIPIKLNNERLKGKNTRILYNKPLIEYILDTLLTVSEINEIYVYCSDQSIKEYLPMGVRFLQRNAELDLPTTNFTQIFDAFYKEIDADIYIYAHATAPFIMKDTIQKCIAQVSDGLYDSAFTAELVQDYLWKDNEPLNFDPENLPRTQDLPKIYKESSGIYVFKKEVFQQLGRRIGKHPYVSEISGKEAVDIDYLDDFLLAEWYLSRSEDNG